MKSLVAGAALIAAPAFASLVPLLPGDTLGGFYPKYQVSATDPGWSGTGMASGRASADRTRDGFVPGVGVIDGLYDVNAFVDTEVIRPTNGQLILSCDFGGGDFSGAGFNGVLAFNLSGFAGYDVTFAYRETGAGTLYAPPIQRTADGDTLSVSFLDPRDILYWWHRNPAFCG